MKILVLGGTRFFGVHLVHNLIKKGHQITIATRGIAKDPFGEKITRLIVERTDFNRMKEVFREHDFDIVYDDLAYCSNDVKYALESIACRRYIMMSSASVYQLTMDTKEESFRPYDKEFVWCDRQDFSYDEVKRSAECALFQEYRQQNAIAIRYPYVIGKDDYTNRLYFYVEHIIKELPMYIDNMDSQMSFISSEEAGRFLAFLSDHSYQGTLNGSSNGTISLKEIIHYVENRTDKNAVIRTDGETAPYNGTNSYSINTDRAKALGFQFSDLKDWIYDLLDYYIEVSLL